MASQFDDSDFVDRDFQTTQSAYPAASHLIGAAAGVASRPPTRQELESRVGEAQQKLVELRRAQEELERERAALEEARRRRLEFQTGREEMLQNLTRGVGLLEQAEFAARRDAEQMSKTLLGLREALGRVQEIHEEAWSQENWGVELSKALATIENGRMEWNSARLKWMLLNGPNVDATPAPSTPSLENHWRSQPFWQLCKIGIALTWPMVLVGLAGLILLICLHPR